MRTTMRSTTMTRTTTSMMMKVMKRKKNTHLLPPRKLHTNNKLLHTNNHQRNNIAHQLVPIAHLLVPITHLLVPITHQLIHTTLQLIHTTSMKTDCGKSWLQTLLHGSCGEQSIKTTFGACSTRWRLWANLINVYPTCGQNTTTHLWQHRWKTVSIRQQNIDQPHLQSDMLLARSSK